MIPNIRLTINRNILAIILFIAILTIIMIAYLKSIFFLLMTSFFLALLLEPIVNLFENKEVKRFNAIFISTLLLAGIGLFWLIVVTPYLKFNIESLNQLAESSTLIWNVKELSPDNKLVEQVGIVLHSIVRFLMEKNIDFSPNSISSFWVFMILLILAFLILKDGDHIKRSFLKLLPNRYFEPSLDLSSRLSMQSSQWITSQISIAGIIGGLSVMALFLLNVSQFLLIGIIVGFAYLIPYYGTIIAAIITIIIVFMTENSLTLILAIIIAFATIKLLYNFLLPAKLTTPTIRLHPLIVFLLLLIGSYLWGITGMLLAVPITSLIIVLCKEILWNLRHYRLF